MIEKRRKIEEAKGKIRAKFAWKVEARKFFIESNHDENRLKQHA